MLVRMAEFHSKCIKCSKYNSTKAAGTEEEHKATSRFQTLFKLKRNGVCIRTKLSTVPYGNKALRVKNLRITFGITLVHYQRTFVSASSLQVTSTKSN